MKFFFDKKHRNLMKLFFSQTVSQFGDRVHQMALIMLIHEKTGEVSAWGLAKLISFTIIPVFVIGPIAGAYVDRWSRRSTLLMCDLIRGMLVLSIPLVLMNFNTMIPIYIIVFLAFAMTRFYVPAKMSLIPELVDEKNLIPANSLMSTTGMIAFVLGMSLGGIFVENYGARVGFLWDSMTFFISALIIVTMSRMKMVREHTRELKSLPGTIQKSIWVDVKAGLKYLIGHKEIRLIILMLFTLLAAAGAIYIVIIVFIQEAFHTVTRDIGLLSLPTGAGLFLGIVLYGKWGHKFSWYKTIFSCLIFGGLTVVAFAFWVGRYPNYWVAASLAAALAMIIGPVMVASNTVAQLVSDENMRGKVFTALEIVIHLGFLITMLLSSWLSQFIPSGVILYTVGLAISVVGMLGFIFFRPDRTLAIDPERGHT